MLRKIDQFGVNFPLGIGKDERFNTKTGAVFSLIYLWEF
jgi:hypothetical protein